MANSMVRFSISGMSALGVFGSPFWLPSNEPLHLHSTS